MASYKDYKTVAAAKKAGSLYFMGKDGKKKLAVTVETLNAWKKKNKGKYKGSALTAWANNKGKNIKPSTSLRPKKRPGSGLSSTTGASGPKTRNQKARAREAAEVRKANKENKIVREQKGGSAASVRNIAEEAFRKPSNEAARKAREKGMLDTIKERAKKRKDKKAAMAKGGMMKKKGYAKGGMMKKKGYAMGGALKKTGPKQTGLKKLPTAVRNKMGYMAKGGMMKKKKGYAKGGATKRTKR
tara:strand:- start:28 stop:756 length:729 start_codon:yes stop_codon:yes gene_type:complete